MTGPLLPPVLEALKLVSEPDGLGLEQVDPRVVVPSDQESRPERSHAAELGVLLLVIADLPHEELDGHRLRVRHAVDLGRESRVVDQDPCIGDEAGRHAGDVLVDLMDLLQAGGLGELRVGDPAVRDQDDAAGVDDPGGRGAPTHGLPRVLDLEEPAVGRENGDRPVVGHLAGLHLHRRASTRPPRTPL
jgi:hypothetical protein